MMNDRFIRAARGEAVDRVPVWYMRQAGRSQPEYRKIKEKYSLFEITHQPELCAHVTRLPVENYGVDAAVLYKDIMTPLPALGVELEIQPGLGPVIYNPIRSLADVERLGQIDPTRDLPFILETIKLLTTEQLEVPLIGFSGAPFTLASYMIEGGPSRTYTKTKALMQADPAAWFTLMDKLGELVIRYTRAQIAAGASAIQIFDSWVGTLSVEDYRTFVKPVMLRIFTELQKENVPLILFAVGANHLLVEFDSLPINVLGLDWRLSISQVRTDKVLQGNLDPALLLAPWKVIERKAREILIQGSKRPGFIFNLGHGVLPETDPAVLKHLTKFVHKF